MTITAPRRSAERVPPHDLDAETALLGAMLLGPAAVAAGLELCTPEDFYNPGHSHIFDAIALLAGHDEPVDPVTVSNQLRADNLLEAAGGGGLLTSLQANTPSSSNAAAYARRVAQAARLRRIISAAVEAAEGAYDWNGEAAAKALEHALDLAALPTARIRVDDVASIVRGDIPSIVPTILARTDGTRLLYPGLTHSIAGEPNAGKTFLALLAVREVLEAGGRVGWLDYEGSPRIIGERLRDLGVPAGAVADRFFYIRPPCIGPAERAELTNLAANWKADLAIVDGIARAIARQGGDEDKAGDVLAFYETVVRPLSISGAAVVMLDHVTKTKDGRGRWARGSSAKLGDVEGAAYTLELDTPFSRSKPGTSRIGLAKDREGVVGGQGDTAGIVRWRPTATRFEVTIDPPNGMAVECATAILRLLESGAEFSRNALADGVRDRGGAWRNDTISKTAERLAGEGRIRVRSGPRRSHLFSVGGLVKDEEQF